jgi:quercetin dioxygenase-like cupin family protein
MRTRTKRTLAGLAVAGAAAVALGAPEAGATPGSGTSSTPPVFGTLAAHTRASQDRVQLRTRGETTVASFTLTYAVGGTSGWHRHPGIVLATVVSGAVTRQVGCSTETFRAGQSFTEVAPHLVRNVYTDPAQPGAVPAVLQITQIYPADAPARRIEVDPPRC